MNRPLLALCDTDEIYISRLDEYLRENLKLSFDIVSFTAVEIFREFMKHTQISLLVISENAYAELKEKAPDGSISNILVLDEDMPGVCEDEESYGFSNIEHTSKYQAAGDVVGNIIDFCVKKSEDFVGINVKNVSSCGKVLGFYSPISKCGQTNLALKMGEELSEKGKTIFLSFERYSSLTRVLGLKEDGDISDLLYYAEGDSNKFCLYLEKVKNEKGSLDVISPVRTAMQLKEINSNNLKHLLDLLMTSGYEYVILDLTDYPDGFFDILRLCDVVYTVTKAGSTDAYRVEIYEDTLRENGYEDVIAMTRKVNMTDVKDTSGLTRTVRELINEREI